MAHLGRQDARFRFFIKLSKGSFFLNQPIGLREKQFIGKLKNLSKISNFVTEFKPMNFGETKHDSKPHYKT